MRAFKVLEETETLSHSWGFGLHFNSAIGEDLTLSSNHVNLQGSAIKKMGGGFAKEMHMVWSLQTFEVHWGEPQKSAMVEVDKASELQI